MRLVNAEYAIYAASFNKKLPYNYNSNKHLIEIAGRTCYKSEEKITKESSDKFIEMIRKRGHCSVLEHSWELRYYNSTHLPHYKFLNFLQIYYVGTLVAGNLRAFEEWDYELKNDFIYPSEDIIDKIYEHKQWNMLSATVKLVVDRGVSHEVVRHRPPAYSQESTRYCNYCQDKFRNQVTFIIPCWLDLPEGEYTWENAPNEISAVNNLGAWYWFKSMCDQEQTYNNLISEGWIPGRARSVLPNSLKTEIVITADLAEWKHIFKLRTAPDAHEQMREVMIPLEQEFKKLMPEIF